MVKSCLEIKTLSVAGFEPAIEAMRNPMNSWDRSDSKWDDEQGRFVVGEKDKKLSQRLMQAGPEHAKHLRLIQAWADIDAPRYW